eukprot:TRINITY_DN29658_c0_g1_i1.p1 TRINITY_DN29658_c0_g1~~TRINITY_DN29658_c0_g1_i1.p1  ORF type:complete len:237 (+),score=51.69 TRINITY_DN29658_c0_g1_i1:193-903(+)
MWELLDDVDFLQESESAGDGTLTSAYDGMVQGEVAKLRAAMHEKDRDVAEQLLEAVIKLRAGILGEAEQDAMRWTAVEKGYADTLKSLRASLAQERASVASARDQIGQMELSLEKDRQSSAELASAQRQGQRALEAERLRCWRLHYEHAIRDREREYTLGVLDTLTTIVRDGNPECGGGCGSAEDGMCVYNQSTDATYCACGYGMYGAHCEHKRCPGAGVPPPLVPIQLLRCRRNG